MDGVWQNRKVPFGNLIKMIYYPSQHNCIYVLQSPILLKNFPNKHQTKVLFIIFNQLDILQVKVKFKGFIFYFCF